MKTKKILLPGMLATMMFAACTNEEIVSVQNEAPEVDLSDRPVVGMVDLNFGPQTRLAQGDDAFNQVVWENRDKIGARIIDAPNGNSFKTPVWNYKAVNGYASSNYEYTKGANDGIWRTEALLVEGNYMFYAPYNPDQGRDALVLSFPYEQTINTIEAGKVNEDAIANFFGNRAGQTVLVGHKFIAADGDPVIKPFMEHVYAYPQITLKNADKFYALNGNDTITKQLTISRIIIADRQGQIANKYQVKHDDLIASMQDAYPAEYEWGNKVHNAQAAGRWQSPLALLRDGKTTDIVAKPSFAETKKVTINLKNAYTAANGEAIKFHAVLPGVEYREKNFTVNVVFKDENGVEWIFVDGVTFNLVDDTADETLTLAPGKRYPREEYDFSDNYKNQDGSVKGYAAKPAAGQLATFTINAGQAVKYTPDAAPVYIKYAREFGEWLAENVENNTVTVKENEDFILEKYKNLQGNDAWMNEKPYMQFSDSLVNIVNQYLDEGTVVFESNMIVSTDQTPDKARFVFLGGIYQTAGKLTLNGFKLGASTFKGEVYLEGGELASSVFNDKATLKNVDASNEDMEFNGDATVDAGSFANLTFNKKATIKNQAKVSQKLTLKSGAESLDAKVDGTTEILGGEATTVAGASYGEVKVYGATFNVTTANYDLSKVTIGNIRQEGNVGYFEKYGKLNVEASTEINPDLVYGELTIDADATMGEDFAKNKWNNATITSNKKLTLSGTVEIPGNRKFINNGTVENGTLNVAKGATVENNYELVVDKNEGNIVTGKNSRTYINDNTAEGTVDNTSLSYVEAGDNQTVSATFENTVDVEAIQNAGPGLRYINKLIFANGLELNKAFDSELLNQVREIEIKAGDVIVSTFASSSVKTLNITGNVTFRGTLDRENTGFGFKNGAKINVSDGKTLTVAYMTMATLSKTEGLEIYGDVHVKDANLYIGVGRTPSYSTSLKGTILNHYVDASTMKNTAVVADAFLAAIERGDANIEIFEDVDLTGSNTQEIKGVTTIDLNGFQLANDDNTVLKVAGKDAKLTIGGGTVLASGKNNCIYNEGGELIILNGTYKTEKGTADRSSAAVLCNRVNGGTWNLTIEDGEFISDSFSAVSLQNNRAEEGTNKTNGMATIMKGSFTGDGTTYWDLYLANVNVSVDAEKCNFTNSRPYLLTLEGSKNYANSMINGNLITNDIHQNGVIIDWTFGIE